MAGKWFLNGEREGEVALVYACRFMKSENQMTKSEGNPKSEHETGNLLPGASWHCYHPERMESISPGLRGTSYPGFTAMEAHYPERVVSKRAARPGGRLKIHPPYPPPVNWLPLVPKLFGLRIC